MSTPKAKNVATRAFLIALVVLILCSILNWGIVTGWGNVKITRIYLVGDDGLQYSALMYVPKNATNETPAPGIMMYHGGSGNARNHESWAVEFSRRGFVVISIDNLGAGNAEYSRAIGNFAVPELFTRYMYNLPIVDSERIALSGHSVGGDMVSQMTAMFQPAVSMQSDGGSRSFLNADAVYTGDYQYIVGEADKSAPKDKVNETVKQIFIKNGVMTEEEELVEGKIYGSFEGGNANRVVWVPKQIHEGAFVNSKHIAALLDFAQQSFDVPNPIDANNQIWKWKDAIGLISMMVFVATMALFALMLIEQVPAFAKIKQPMPRNVGMRGKDLCISISAALLFPILCLYTGAFGLVNLFGATSGPNTPIFRIRFATIALAVVLALNLFGLLMFFLFHKVWGKKKFNATIRDYGLTSEGSKGLDWALIGKAFLLAVITATVGWTYLAIQGGVLGTDFYCLFFGFKPIPAVKFIYYIPFIIVWIICFAIASVGMNVERRLPSTGKEWLDTAIAVVFNGLLATAGITIMVIIENAIQIHLGTDAVALASWKTDITRLWGMPAGMFIGGAGNTYLYRKTGNIWLGAILMGIVCALAACLYGQLQF